MHYEKSQIADTFFKTHEQLKIFEQPDSQLSMNNIYYSLWKTSQNALKNIQTRTQAQEVRMLPQLMKHS